MFSAPSHELFILGEDGINQLIEDVFNGLAEELRVRVQRLVRLVFKTRDKTNECLPACPRLDQRHD